MKKEKKVKKNIVWLEKMLQDSGDTLWCVSLWSFGKTSKIR